MMRIARRHPWPTTPRAAIALQEHLRGEVRLKPIEDEPRLLAGLDGAFSPDKQWVIAGVILWDVQARDVLEQHVARVPCRFPYVPGLLSFRELPGCLAAMRKLRRAPEAVLCDAQGIAHPRRIGLASHLGLWLKLPTIGCAKSRLCGTAREVGRKRGSKAPLMLDEERVGTVLRTRDGVKPLFVSPGHLCDHDAAVRVTLAAAIKYRLPEPTRLAHQLVTRARSA